jgi:hypothetical protein
MFKAIVISTFRFGRHFSQHLEVVTLFLLSSNDIGIQLISIKIRNFGSPYSFTVGYLYGHFTLPTIFCNELRRSYGRHLEILYVDFKL